MSTSSNIDPNIAVNQDPKSVDNVDYNPTTSSQWLDIYNAISGNTSGSSSSTFGDILKAILGTQGASGTGAGLALGLGALAAALTRQQAPTVKAPEYKAAPVYNRALTAPMFPPQPAPQKSASGQNIYTPMKGMPLFFNPNPFQFDAAEAAKRYGPTAAQIAQGQAGYEAGLASLYKPMTVAPFTYAGTSAAPAPTTAPAPKDAPAPSVPPPPPSSSTSTQSSAISSQNAATNTESASGMDQDLLNYRSGLGLDSSQTMGSTIRSQIGFDPVTGKPITGNEPEPTTISNTIQSSSIAATPTAAQLAEEYAKQNAEMKTYQDALLNQQANLQSQELAKQTANAPFTSTTVQDFDEFGTPYYRSQTTQEMIEAGKDPTGMERLEQTTPIIWGPTTSFYGGQIPSGASGGSIDDILVGYGGGSIGYNQGGDVYAYARGQYLQGDGDGMSDSIPATINNKQPARLADGEFVVPADVVSDLGNGSSNAGAKKLYDMMKRIRQARHGTKKQPPEVKADKAMPR
jgi:hypothetical protein